MFTIQNLFDFLNMNQGIKKLFQSEIQKELTLRTMYGHTEKVPLIFYDSNFGTRGPTKMTKTPNGKVIFPGTSMVQQLETGVLYFLNLTHHASRNGGGYCHTVGTDWRTKAYWDDLLADRKISAIKTCRYATNLGLREAKDIAEQDYVLVKPTYVSGTPVIPNYYTQSASQTRDLEFKLAEAEKKIRMNEGIIQDQRWELSTIRGSIDRQKRENEELHKELTKTLMDFTNYVKINKPTISKVNVWAIIGCKQTDDSATIKAAIKKALKLYHPDRVFECGQLLQDLAATVTRDLFELSKKIK